jgi:hypothetical protein
MMTMIKKLYIARSPRIAARKLGNEMLVMSGADSTLFTLNSTATMLWQAADGTTPLNEIVSRCICPEFDVQQDEALRDAEELATNLSKHGILLLSEKPISPQSVRPSTKPAQETA